MWVRWSAFLTRPSPALTSPRSPAWTNSAWRSSAISSSPTERVLACRVVEPAEWCRRCGSSRLGTRCCGGWRTSRWAGHVARHVTARPGTAASRSTSSGRCPPARRQLVAAATRPERLPATARRAREWSPTAAPASATSCGAEYAATTAATTPCRARPALPDQPGEPTWSTHEPSPSRPRPVACPDRARPTSEIRGGRVGPRGNRLGLPEPARDMSAGSTPPPPRARAGPGAPAARPGGPPEPRMGS
jgi:hypothetical protein